ncbi:uncharacterized protein LOC129772104 [Toxorhynchites rutilus septentrionalis]|uniref:uncharacterized protein LOC129772104 n=1 Tax=Toxorhynchites rutilus septentrionalis TaxID=329112 RepID=UPI0024799C5A|nr:uncharacterized protein LOC129772104 [Toxorhynchites rutilus septentrionalis]
MCLGVCLKILVMVLTLGVTIRCDWVEIPFLQPSTTTQRPVVLIRHKQIDQRPGADTISHVLPSVVDSGHNVVGDNLDDERDSEVSRFQGEISDLVDSAAFAQNIHKGFYVYPRTNVSNKLFAFPATENRRFVTDLIDRDQAPMTNKYEEELIEYLDTKPPLLALSVGDRIDLPTLGASNEVVYEETIETSEEDPNSSGQSAASNSAGISPNIDYHDAPSSEQYKNVSIRRLKILPGTDRVTILRVLPPRRFHRPEVASDENGFMGFIKFLKRMQDGFVMKTTKTIGDKIKVLQDLKNQLLLSIAKRMSFLWTQPAIANPAVSIVTDGSNRRGGRRRRVKRGTTSGWMDHSSAHGGMDFPSAEAALLTISFLTFAVFLIKLVLQVINTIKAKHYTYNTMTGLAGITGNTLKIVKRTKRSNVKDAAWRNDLDILDAINSYSYV